MAPVTRPRDRGQLILVAGLTVAVILVMLVLLLNTVIYTENLATRGIGSGGGDALEYRATVVGSVEELIERENEHYDEGHSPSEGVTGGIDVIDASLSQQHLNRGTIAEVGYEGGYIDEGTLIIWQTNSDTFVSNEKSEWTLANSVNEVSNLEITVDHVDMAATDPFSIVIDDWIMQIEKREDPENAENTEVVVTIENAEQGPEVLIENEGPLVIDLVTGTVNGQDISTKPTFTESGIEFRNGDAAAGTLELRSDGIPGEVTKHGEEGEEPYYTSLVDSVDLMIHYETSQVRFVTEETVRAEEP